MPARLEQGFSLVESVVALAILGFIVAAMVGGLATTIATSDIHRQESEANTVLVSAAEIVKSATYSSCAETPYPTDQALPPAPRWAGAIKVSVSYWSLQNSTWEPSCHDNDGNLFPMQRVTIMVTDPGKRATAHIDIVKRGP